LFCEIPILSIVSPSSPLRAAPAHDRDEGPQAQSAEEVVMKIKSIEPAYGWLTILYPGVRSLDIGSINIDAPQDQIEEAEKDILIKALEEDDTLLLGVSEALSKIIQEIKLDLCDSAQDAAWELFSEKKLPNEKDYISRCLHTNRSPNLEEIKYWRSAFETEYKILVEEG
jgi:hypothetical protein